MLTGVDDNLIIHSIRNFLKHKLGCLGMTTTDWCTVFVANTFSTDEKVTLNMQRSGSVFFQSVLYRLCCCLALIGHVLILLMSRYSTEV